MEIWTQFYQKRKDIFFTFLIGLFGHFVKLITYLPHADCLEGFELSPAGMLEYGRWFSGIIGTLLGSSADLQWVEGTVAIFFFALTIQLILGILDIQNRPLRICAIVLFLFFPSITSTMVYSLWAAPYGFAFFLAVYAVYLCIKEPVTPLRFLCAVLCVTFSSGIYQIYVTSAAILLVYYIIKKLLNRSRIQMLIKPVVTAGAAFVLGLVLYFVIQKITSSALHTQLSDYQGVANIGHVNLSIFIHALKTLIYENYTFYFGNRTAIIYFLLDAVILATIFFTWIYVLFSQKLGALRNTLIVLLLAVTPVLSYSLLFVTYGIRYHTVMEGGNYFVYLGFIMLLDFIPALRKKVSVFGAVLITLLCYYHFINNNRAYKQLEMGYQTTLYQSFNILNHIEDLEEASDIRTIAICGKWNPENPFPPPVPAIEGSNTESITYTSYHFCQFAAYNLGRRFTPADQEIQDAIMKTDEYQQMGFYPYGRYVQVINNTIVVKLGDNS